MCSLVSKGRVQIQEELTEKRVHELLNYQELKFIQAGNIKLDYYISLLRKSFLERISIDFGSDKQNSRFKQITVKYEKTVNIQGVYCIFNSNKNE